MKSKVGAAAAGAALVVGAAAPKLKVGVDVVVEVEFVAASDPKLKETPVEVEEGIDETEGAAVEALSVPNENETPELDSEGFELDVATSAGFVDDSAGLSEAPPKENENEEDESELV